MLSHRDIIRALRTALKALPEHPHACDVVAAPGSGTRTIVVRDSRGRPLLTVSALAAVYAPAVPGREQRTLDELAPRPELPVVPPLAVDPMAPGFRILRVGDLVFAPDLATWTVGEIARETDGGVESVVVRLDQGGRSAVVDRAEITLDAADLWGCEKLPAVKAVETVRVWIAESVWDALTPDDRDDLEHPIGGLTIDWQGTEGWVWSRVARDEVLITLRGVAEAHGVELVEGEEQPAPMKVAKKMRAKKTAKSTASAAQVEAARVRVEAAVGLGPDDFGGSDYPDPMPAPFYQTPSAPVAEPEAPPAVTTLRVPRGPWLLHRSELRDTSTGPLHKKWLPVGEDRAVIVPRGSELVGIIRGFCVANKVPLWIDDVQVSPPVVGAAAPAKPTRARKGAAR